MRFSLRLTTTVLAIGAMFGCGGGGYNAGSATTPTTPTATTTPAPSTPTPTPAPTPAPAPAATFTISVVGSSGSNAFSPNPSTVTSGSAVVWKNNDSVTHHIVMDNGSADLGDLAPGASTRSVTVASGSFHCTLHPTMVGSINGPLPSSPAPAPIPFDPGPNDSPYSRR